MNKKTSYIIIFSLLLVLTIGAISIDYVKQLGSIMAQGETPNPGHALNEIAEWETLVKTSGDQTIAGVKTFSGQVVAPEYCLGDDCIDSWPSFNESDLLDEIIIIVDGDSCPDGYFIDRVSLGDCSVDGACSMFCPSLGWVPSGSYYCNSRMPSTWWGCLSTSDGSDCLRPVEKVKCMKDDYNDYYLSTSKQTIFGEKVFKNGLWIAQNGNVRVGGVKNVSVPSSQLEVFGDIRLTGNVKLDSLQSKSTFDIMVDSISGISINRDGNVGIGKYPNVKLDVNGKVKAIELEVNDIISNGLIKIGDSSLECSFSKEGSVKYNQLTKNLEVCNGLNWISFSQKACQLDGVPQTTSWGENKYNCSGDDYRCFNGQCRKCEGTLIGEKCWYSVSTSTPCSDRGGVDDPYYSDPDDCTICSTLIQNTDYWLGQPISCEGPHDYGAMALPTGPMHYNTIECYYHNSSSNRENPASYPPYMPYDGVFWAPCKY
jgi:hypothetical protein